VENKLNNRPQKKAWFFNAKTSIFATYEELGGSCTYNLNLPNKLVNLDTSLGNFYQQRSETKQVIALKNNGTMTFAASELVLNKQGKVYHLDLSPEQLASKIILVGDQGRVAQVSNFFDTIEHKVQHREFVTHTGKYKGVSITALSTGIGTDNIDIVMHELDALVNIDLHTRTTIHDHTQLELVRIGTCGILQAEIPLHGYILSKAALGLDNIAHFYQIAFSPEEQQMNQRLIEHIKLPENVIPYYVSADSMLVQRLSSEKTHSGITVTSSGFYGPQGRQLNLPTKTPQLNDRLSSFQYERLQITNFEMESSALFALSKGMNHKSTTICLGIANRPKMQFSQGYEHEMNELIIYVLNKLTKT